MDSALPERALLFTFVGQLYFAQVIKTQLHALRTSATMSYASTFGQGAALSTTAAATAFSP